MDTKVVRLSEEVLRRWRAHDSITDALKWNEGDHPREPPGSEDGGQFTDAGGGGGGGGGGGVTHESLVQQHGPVVAKEGQVYAYSASSKHGGDPHSVNNKPISRVDVILFRGTKAPKPFGTIKSKVESNADRGTGQARPTTLKETVVYELRTPEQPLRRHTSFKAAMNDAEQQRKDRNARLRLDRNKSGDSIFALANAFSLALRGNPNHEPAGSSIGGQFASGGGSSGDVNFTVHSHGKVSPKFARDVADAVSKAPFALLKRVGPPPIHVFDTSATYNKQAPVLFGFKTKNEGWSAVTSFDKGEPTGISFIESKMGDKNIKGIRYLANHELTHALDAKLGFMSNSKEFKDTFRADMARLKKVLDDLKPKEREETAKYIMTEYGHLLEGHEAFAEAGARLISEEVLVNEFEDIFPGTMAYVEKVLIAQGIIKPPAADGSAPGMQE